FGVAALGTGGCGSVGAELDFAIENSASAPRVHHQQNKVCGLATDLEANAFAFEPHHGRRDPWALELLAGSANHDTAAAANTNNECTFNHGRINDDAFCLVDQVLRDIVGNVHNFFEDQAAILKTVGFTFVIFCGERYSSYNEGRQECSEFLHNSLLDAFFPEVRLNKAGRLRTF